MRTGKKVEDRKLTAEEKYGIASQELDSVRELIQEVKLQSERRWAALPV